MENMDIKRLIDNVKSIASIKKIKITDLEKEAYVSQGYLSRIENSDYNTRPNIVNVKNIADILNVSINLLITYDLTTINTDLIELLDKLDKIKDMSDSNTIDWHSISIDGIRAEYIENKNVNLIPLIKEIFGSFSYVSSFTDHKIDNFSDILFFKYNNKTYFLSKITIIRNQYYEFYAYTSEKNLIPICAEKVNDKILGSALGNLYASGYNNSIRFKLKNNVRKILSEF